MKTPLIFLISLTTLYTATGVEGLETTHLDAEIGSSVSFPGEKIDNFTFYDLRRSNGSNGDVVVTCHDGCEVRVPYTQRGHFYQHNGTFLLTQLRKEDSGIFEYKVNLTLKGRIHLRVMAPVMDQILKHEGKRNGTRCPVTFTCQAEGDGPLSFTILRNNEILHTVTGTDNSTSLSMDGWDPETSGIFSCVVRNAVSAKTSPSIELSPPVTPGQMETALIVIGLFLQWGITMLYSLSDRGFPICRTSWGEWRPRNVYRGEGVQSLHSKALTAADNIFGFIKESLVVNVSVYEFFIPVWCGVIAACFLLCRAIYWIIILVNSHRETRVKFSSSIKCVCAVAMHISAVLGVPAFCVTVLVVFYKYHSRPCGMTSEWPLYVLVMPVAFLVLCLISYFYLKKKSKAIEMRESPPEDDKPRQTELQNGFISRVPNGGNGGPPEDIGNPDREARGPGVIVDVPNGGDQKNREEEASCANSTEEAPEDHSIPKPEEGQSQGSVEIPRKRHLEEAPNHEDPDEDTERQCLLTVPSEVVALDKDRVANG